MFSLKITLVALFFIFFAITSSTIIVLSNNYTLSIISFIIMILTLFSLWYFFNFIERTESAEKIGFTFIFIVINFLTPSLTFFGKNVGLFPILEVIVFLISLLVILIKEILYPKNFNKWQVITAILSLYPTIGLVFGFFILLTTA